MDTISNMLAMIKNAQAVKKETVTVPCSNLKFEIVKVLAKYKFIKDADKKGKKNKKVIEIVLAYDERGNPAINCAERVSKPSRRIYIAADKIKLIRQGAGLQILSTSKGILADREARKEKVGGELICKIW